MKRYVLYVLNTLRYMDPILFMAVMLLVSIGVGLIAFVSVPVLAAMWHWASDTTVQLIDWIS